MAEFVETIVVGGGQAGLAVSYYLSQQGREHTVFEQASQAGEAWRNHRWDSFTLVTPNWMIRMPGAEYDEDDADGFMPRDEIVAYLEDYIERFKVPIRYSTRVTSVERTETGYLVNAGETAIEAANVVIATGLYQLPRIPSFSANLAADVHQLHSSEYRNPEALPPGAVLVVGSAQSGGQIAEELYQSGRQVYLCVSTAGRAPRRYRGRDTVWWLHKIGVFDTPVESLASPEARFSASILVSGKAGGHSVNPHQFARDGVVLLGHLQAIQGDKITLAPDLKEALAKVDKFEADLLKRIDEYIEKNELDAPKDVVPQLTDGYGVDVITELDLRAAGITSVIWATGYRFDFGLVKLPILDDHGFPIQKRGVTAYPGLYFVGLPWLPVLKSGLLFGVGDNASYVVSDIVGRSHR